MTDGEAVLGYRGGSLTDGEAVLGLGEAVWPMGRQFEGSGRQFGLPGQCIALLTCHKSQALCNGSQRSYGGGLSAFPLKIHRSDPRQSERSPGGRWVPYPRSQHFVVAQEFERLQTGVGGKLFLSCSH